MRDVEHSKTSLLQLHLNVLFIDAYVNVLSISVYLCIFIYVWIIQKFFSCK